MNDAIPLPLGATNLIVAGPRAGKTSLLLRWLAECPSPTLYLGVTPEDEAPGFLLHRCLANWPAIREAYEAQPSGMQGAPWGGRLGLAIARAHPDFCLLVDDFHLTESMANAGEWLALLRHFPTSGTLVVASRHRIPELNRPSLRVWGPADFGWTERPTVQDLFALPAPLRSKAIVLQIVGEALPSLEGEELVRRGVAERDPSGLHRLRLTWQDAVLPATRSRAIESAVWAEVEAELASFLRRHLGTAQDRHVPRILDRLPSEVRQRSPFLLRVEGDLLFEQELNEAAQETFQRALQLASDPELASELRVRLLGVASRQAGDGDFARLLADLEAQRPMLPPRVEVRLRYWRAASRWRPMTDLAVVRQEMASVLAVPASGDREVLSYHIQALYVLASGHIEHDCSEEAVEYAQRLIALCEAHGFHRYLLTAYALRLSSLLTYCPVSLERLVEVPDEAFDGANSTALSVYLCCFGEWASRIGAHRFAQELLGLALAHAVGHGLAYRILHCKYWMLSNLLSAGSFEGARTLYEDLMASPAYQNFYDNMPLVWVWGLIMHGKLAEAEAALREVTGDPARRHLYQLWIRDLRGEEGAREEALAFLQGPESAHFAVYDREVAVHFGLCEAPTSFYLSAFGDAGFGRLGGPAPRWPRKKALSLLAHLALNPDGLPAADLVALLSRDSEAQDPLAALHTHAYHLRTALATVGAGNLLDSVRGHYRFDWGKVAFCEVHGFDQLFRKAEALEGRGQMEVAALFYRMVTLLAREPLFANLPDEAFEAPRRTYAARVDYARAFVEAHAPGLIKIDPPAAV